MDSIELDLRSRSLEGEFAFQASRSSGAGGQHVNKVSSRIELRFNIPASQQLSDKEKEVLMTKLASRLTKEGELLIACEETRSQHRNRQACIEKFFSLLSQSLKPEKKRKPTRPSKAARLKRLKQKRSLSEKKALRKPPTD